MVSLFNSQVASPSLVRLGSIMNLSECDYSTPKSTSLLEISPASLFLLLWNRWFVLTKHFAIFNLFDDLRPDSSLRQHRSLQWLQGNLKSYPVKVILSSSVSCKEAHLFCQLFWKISHYQLSQTDLGFVASSSSNTQLLVSQSSGDVSPEPIPMPEHSA